MEDELAHVFGCVHHQHNSFCIDTTVVGGSIDSGVCRAQLLRSRYTPISLSEGDLSRTNSIPIRLSRPRNLSTLLCESHEAIHEEHEKRK